jgi:hypothetical protein
VFENDLVELDAAATLTAAEANEHTLITAETRRLQIAAHWADLHPGDAVTQSRLPGTQQPIRFGGEGTPTVADFAPAELGCVLRISDGSAARLIGDALDLRHRLKLIWAAALAGQVPAYQARRIAAATRHLTANQAGWVGGCPTRPIVGDAVVGSAAHPARGHHHPRLTRWVPTGRRRCSRTVRAARPQQRAWAEADHRPRCRR